MGTDRDELLQANARFYQALEGLDLPSMDSLWLHEGWVRCVHPGRDALTGWGAVRRSWEQIFAATEWMRVTPTDVQAEADGDVGIVCCSESISAKGEEGVGVAAALATNLFRRTAGGWRLFHHHASPAPLAVTAPFDGRLQ